MHVKLPRYSEEEIKKIEEEFEGIEWKEAKEVFGEEVEFKSVFVFEKPERAKKVRKAKK